ncbi:hypothetical protein Trydic_g23576 [Trypoxylus dichotomus]
MQIHRDITLKGEKKENIVCKSTRIPDTAGLRVQPGTIRNFFRTPALIGKRHKTEQYFAVADADDDVGNSRKFGVFLEGLMLEWFPERKS